jgi:hypothetical protein
MWSSVIRLDAERAAISARAVDVAKAPLSCASQNENLLITFSGQTLGNQAICSAARERKSLENLD